MSTVSLRRSPSDTHTESLQRAASAPSALHRPARHRAAPSLHPPKEAKQKEDRRSSPSAGGMQVPMARNRRDAPALRLAEREAFARRLRESTWRKQAQLSKPPPPETAWSMETDHAEWTRNRGGGGCWPKAPMETCTLLATMEKHKLETAARAPPPVILWSPAHRPPPGWSVPEGGWPVRWPVTDFNSRPYTLSWACKKPPPPQPSQIRKARKGNTPGRKGAQEEAPSSVSSAVLERRSELWPPLDVSSKGYSTPEDLLALLGEGGASALVAPGRAVPKLVYLRSESDIADEAAKGMAKGDGGGNGRGGGSDEDNGDGDRDSDGGSSNDKGDVNNDGDNADGDNDEDDEFARYRLFKKGVDDSARHVCVLGHGEVQSAKPRAQDRSTATVRFAFQTRALHANNNQLSTIESLPGVVSRLLVDPQALITLDLSANQIARLPETIGTLVSLEVLQLHHNQLAIFADLAYMQPLASLARLTLMYNPLTMQRMSSVDILALKTASPLFCDESYQVEYKPKTYRLRVLAMLPMLRQLDLMPVTSTERAEAALVGARVSNRSHAGATLRSRPHPKDLANQVKYLRK